MCGSQQPLEGADSTPIPIIVGDTEPPQIQCGTWVDRSEDDQGFCKLAPDHKGHCRV